MYVGGVYDSPDHYFDTVQKLWIAMTFGKGNEALSPKCMSSTGDGKYCNQVTKANV
jgi:hypothetical protein